MVILIQEWNLFIIITNIICVKTENYFLRYVFIHLREREKQQQTSMCCLQYVPRLWTEMAT